MAALAGRQVRDLHFWQPRRAFHSGRPWSKDFGGLYSTDMDGNVSEWLEGDWGVGNRAHIVISHGPPKYILDTVNGGFATSAGAPPKGRGPAGCNLLLGKLRRVKPLVAAWGHVHAEQGMAWLKWKSTKAFKDWRKAGKEALERGAPYPDPPPSAPRRASLRAVHGRDLSQVHASILPYDDPGAGCESSDVGEAEPVLTRKALETDFAHTLLVNAASLNATISGVQHGLRPGTQMRAGGGTGLSAAEAAKRVRTLRSPIVVDVYPEKRGEPRERGRAVLIPLGVDRFPEL